MLKVLIVDDERIIRRGLRTIIDWEHFGFEIVGEAEDGEVAIEQIKRLNPQVLITDIRMPFLDGIALQNFVFNNKRWIYTIVISGYDDFIYAQQMLNLGAFGYMLKPTDVEELIKMLLRIKADYALHRENESSLGGLENYLEDAHLPESEKQFDLDIADLTVRMDLSSRQSIENSMEQLKSAILQKGESSYLYTQYVIMNTFARAVKLASVAGCDEARLFGRPPMEVLREIFHIPSVEQRLQELTEVLIELNHRLLARDGKQLAPILAKAREYLEVHYGNEELTLGDVASHVGMSFGYFSVLFKREMGESFVDCLTRIRLEKARELLMVSSLKTYEIAHRVGYANPTYFSTLFKKKYGKPPSEFREQSSS